MARVLVPIENAIPVRRTKGITVTFVNQTAIDVFFDENPNRLNVAAPGVAPDGTKLSANGGQLQWDNFPGVVWFRSATATFIEVQA